MARIIVVGAGLGGLATACQLTGAHGTSTTSRGRPPEHDIVVLERGTIPGGRAGLIEDGGYRFDTGPSVLTMTGILSDTFAAAGADMADHLRIHAVDPMYRACFEDGSELLVRHGHEPMTEEIRRFAGAAEAASFGRFVDWLTELYRVEMPSFIDRNFDGVTDLARPPGPGLKLARLGGFGKLHRQVAKYFRDPRLQRIFSFQAMYAGLSPMEALGAYAVITYMDTVAGVYFPEGGMHAVARGLADAAEAGGVRIRYGVEVERVLLGGGPTGARPVQGVRLTDGEVVPGDVVVVNADLPAAYPRLLPDLAPPRRLGRAKFSPSCALWLGGVRGPLPAGHAHHNIHFGAEWDQAFDDITTGGRRMRDPSILVTVPTVSDPSMAPAPDGHVLYVLEPTPHLGGSIDWRVERGPFRDSLVAHVEALGYPASGAQVVTDRFFDPTDWERMGMAMGTPFGLAHTFLQTGPFRPSNVDRRAPGLVWVGSSTVPGVGVPMVLLSGRLAAERVRQHVEQTAR